MSACREPSHSLIELRRPAELGAGLGERADARLEFALRRSAAAAASRRRAALERASATTRTKSSSAIAAERAAERLAESQGIAVEDDKDLVHGADLS